MSAITIESDLVHYEVLGRGRPVIFVHGWLGSWRYWVPTMQQLSIKYRTYALDLWGFGDSGKDSTRYGLQAQVNLLAQFFDRLGIPKAALIGHSLGAAVCLNFARQFPEKAYRMMLISPPLFDQGGLSEEGRPESVSPVSTQPMIQIVPSVPTPAPVTPPAAPAPEAANTSAPPPPASPNPPANADAAPGPVSAPGTPASTTPLTAPNAGNSGAFQYSSAAETLPRSPFRSRGETPEEILARLRAKSTGTQTQPQVVQPQPPGTARPTETTVPASIEQPAPRPMAPMLPTSIAKPIIPPSAPVVSPGTPQTPPVPRGASNNPLVGLLTGTKPAALLGRHAERDIPDLDALRAEVDKTDEKVMLLSAQSFDSVNLALELKRVTAPTLLLHGEDDTLLAPPPLDLLRRIEASKAAGQFLSILESGVRHFPMMEITAKFNRLLIDFLEAPDLTNVQFKDQWKRTMR